MTQRRREADAAMHGGGVGSLPSAWLDFLRGEIFWRTAFRFCPRRIPIYRPSNAVTQLRSELETTLHGGEGRGARGRVAWWLREPVGSPKTDQPNLWGL